MNHPGLCGCASAADCEGTEVCDAVAGMCSNACEIDADCVGFAGGKQPFCDAGSGKCIGCRTTADCPIDGNAREMDTKLCGQCESDSDCAVSMG